MAGPFKLRSGNKSPLEFKLMGSSPLKHDQPKKIKYNKDGSVKKVKFQKHTHDKDNPDPDLKKVEVKKEVIKEKKPGTPVKPEPKPEKPKSRKKGQPKKKPVPKKKSVPKKPQDPVQDKQREEEVIQMPNPDVRPEGWGLDR